MHQKFIDENQMFGRGALKKWKNKKTVTCLTWSWKPEDANKLCCSGALTVMSFSRSLSLFFSPFCEAYIGVNEPWMLNCFPLTRFLLFCWRGRWRRIVRTPTLLKVAWSMLRLRGDGRTVHCDTPHRLTHELSTRRRKLCTHCFFLVYVFLKLLLTFESCVSI